MSQYQRGKIYKLISNQTDLIYYGSTIEEKLTKRLGGHRAHFKLWLSGNSNYISSFEIVKFDDCKIILVETYPCNTKYELTAREQWYIDNNECVNKRKANTGLLHDLNIAEYKKQYREKYINRQKELMKKWYGANKEELHINHTCICGSIITHKNDIKRHLKTKKHQGYVSNQSMDETHIKKQ